MCDVGSFSWLIEGGGLAGLLIGALREAAFGDSSDLGLSCPTLSSFESGAWQPDLLSWCIGVLCGLLLGPLLDLAFLRRVQALRQARRRLSGVAGWYRVVDE